MLIKNIYMELRSRLRSCNVFISTGINLSKNCNLKISIQSTCIVLNYYNEDCELPKRRDSLSSIESLSDCYSTEDENEVMCTIPVEEFCMIIPNSMSCLKIDNNTISFRVATEPTNSGNFYKELLSTDTETKMRADDEQTINVKANSNIKIVCLNCANDISSAVMFHRILELPSANLDMSEWFCHGHGSSHSHDHGHNSQDQTLLKPNKKDFLYRLTYFVINASLMSENANKFNSKRNVYHCNRCLAWLGLKERDTVKLFNSEVKMNQDGVEVQAISHENCSEDIKTDDFIFTIERLAKEYNLGLQYMIVCKIVLECTLSDAKKQYLLIWIMDKELQVLRNTDDATVDDQIKLQSSFLTKILYKVAMSLTEEVESWLADPAVVCTDISKSMFCSGLDHLQKMSLKVPEAFRTTNGYHVTYLKS